MPLDRGRFLASPGLEPLVTLTEGAARTIGVIRRNIAFSIGYNLIGATLAATGVITPLIAAVLMPASSLTVVLASWLSRTFPRTRHGARGVSVIFLVVPLAALIVLAAVIAFVGALGGGSSTTSIPRRFGCSMMTLGAAGGPIAQECN